MKTNISLVGPRSVGKSSIGKILSQKLKYNYIDLDKFSEKELKNEGGIRGFIKKRRNKDTSNLVWKNYWKYQHKFLLKIFSKSTKIVLDVGGGTFVEVFSKIKRNANLIAKKSKVICLLPSKKDSTAINILTKREMNRSHWKEKNLSKKEMKIIVKRDYLAAKEIYLKKSEIIFYTENKSKKQIVNELLNKIK